MFSLSSIVQKAQSLIPTTTPSYTLSTDQDTPRATLFRKQFRLPDTQSPLQEIAAELTLGERLNQRRASQAAVTQGERNRDKDYSVRYAGRLHLSEQYLCFSTQGSSFLGSASAASSTSFTGQTHGAGPAGNGFTLPLCAVRRVERLPSQTHLFGLVITTWNGFNGPTSSTGKVPIPVQQRNNSDINNNCNGSTPSSALYSTLRVANMRVRDSATD